MPSIVNAIVQSPVARTIVLFVIIIPISFYLGTTSVRRGILYYLEVFTPSVVVAIACYWCNAALTFLILEIELTI
jgi:hypothetical protein